MKKNIKITILSSFPFPNGKATANRIDIIAKRLSKISIVKKIDIISANPKSANTEIYLDKINIQNVKSKNIDKSKLIKRFFSELILSYRLYKREKKINNEILIITIPSILILLPFLLSKRKNSIILDIFN